MPLPVRVVLLVAVLGLTGCGGGGASAPPQDQAGFSAEVREAFLGSCVENARRTSGGQTSDAQLDQTCGCILGKVEQEYGEADFKDFEQRLLAGKAPEQESDRLVQWSTDCAEDAA